LSNHSVVLSGKDDPYFSSKRFLTVDYWEAKWKARQYWFEQEALFEERELERERKRLASFDIVRNQLGGI